MAGAPPSPRELSHPGDRSVAFAFAFRLRGVDHYAVVRFVGQGVICLFLQRTQRLRSQDVIHHGRARRLHGGALTGFPHVEGRWGFLSFFLGYRSLRAREPWGEPGCPQAVPTRSARTRGLAAPRAALVSCVGAAENSQDGIRVKKKTRCVCAFIARHGDHSGFFRVGRTRSVAILRASFRCGVPARPPSARSAGHRADITSGDQAGFRPNAAPGRSERTFTRSSSAYQQLRASRTSVSSIPSAVRTR